MRFLIDAQLPPALAGALIAAGHEAEHLEAIGLRDAKDAAIWEYACQTGAILVTKDEDFIERFRRGPVGASLLWLRIGNASTRALLAWFAPLLPSLIKRLADGDRFIEVR